jgi:hypothetical protein
MMAKLTPAELASAHREHMAGVSYKELEKRYEASETQLRKMFRPLGLRGKRGKNAYTPHKCCVHVGDKYDLYMRELLRLAE